MARKTGSSSTVTVPLSVLTEKLNGLGGNVKVKVGKGWLRAIEEAHEIDFGIAEDEDAAPADKTAPVATAATDARPSATVE